MLKLLSSGSEIELSRPTVIPSLKAPYASKLFRVLSKFGPEAPSFWNERGTEYPCTQVEKSVVKAPGADRVTEIDLYGNMPSQIVFTSKPLLLAVKDMEMVITRSKIRMDLRERSGRYRNVSVVSEETRKQLWKELVALCSLPSSTAEGSSTTRDATQDANFDDVINGLLG
ncbi:hypothetical protein K3495_g16043 [Podosphaera aphanis]|nr:hypothetical protein K3495_g16043 [Podosphaera aphanis]